MNQRGFATIFGLCLILAVVLVVKGIQEAEANHVREVMNFHTEQALQHAAESAIVEAAEIIRKAAPSETDTLDTTTPIFADERQASGISVEVFGKRGKIYVNNSAGRVGTYFMSTATSESPFLSKKNYRRAYAYVLDGDATIRFMQEP